MIYSLWFYHLSNKSVSCELMQAGSRRLRNGNFHFIWEDKIWKALPSQCVFVLHFRSLQISFLDIIQASRARARPGIENNQFYSDLAWVLVEAGSMIKLGNLTQGFSFSVKVSVQGNHWETMHTLGPVTEGSCHQPVDWEGLRGRAMARASGNTWHADNKKTAEGSNALVGLSPTI